MGLQPIVGNIDSQVLNDNLSYLQSIINAINAGPKGVYNTLAELHAAYPTGNTNIYLITNDPDTSLNGKWVFWNGSAWTAGGVYQSTGLGANIVDKTNLSDNIKTKGFPFVASAIPDQPIKDSILDIKLFNANKNKLYTLAVVRKNYGVTHSWALNIYEWVNGAFGTNPVCQFVVDNYIRITDIEVIRLISTGGNMEYADVTIDWTKVPDGTNLSSMDYTKTGLHAITYFTPYVVNDYSITTNKYENGSVTPIKLSDSIKTKGYPFVASATPDTVVRDAILSIKVFNADKTKQYTLAVVRKKYGANNTYAMNIYEWINGTFGANPVCEFIADGYTPFATIEIIRLTSSGSNLYADVLVDWSKLSDGANFSSLGYDKTGLHPLTINTTFVINPLSISNNNLMTDIKTKNYPFTRSAVPSQILVNAVLDIKLYNADRTKLYTFAVLRKNSVSGGITNRWQINIYEWINGTFSALPVCNFSVDGYVPSSTIETVRVPSYGISGIYADVTIDWSQVPDATALTGMQYGTAGISLLTYRSYFTFPKSFTMFKYQKVVNVDANYFTNAYFIGFWERRTVNGVDCMATVFYGAEIIARIKGTTSIAANFVLNLGVSNYANKLYYKVDDNEWVQVTVTSAITIAAGLSTDEHIIRIRTDDFNLDDDQFHTLKGGWNFSGFTLDAGGSSEPVKPKSRYGKFFGDSITAGVGAGSAYNFVSKLCEKLRVQDIRIAFPGGGLFSAPRTYLPTLNEYAHYSSTGIEGKADEPDFIMINIGTNDLSSSSSDFQNALRTLLNRLQRKHAGIDIFLLRPFNGAHVNDILAVYGSYSNVTYIDTTNWVFTTTDGVHPDVAGAESLASYLANVLLGYYGKEYFIV